MKSIPLSFIALFEQRASENFSIMVVQFRVYLHDNQCISIITVRCMRGAHVTVGAAAEARRCLLAVPFPFRRGRHGRSIAYTVPLRGHSKREFSKASCVVETAAWFAARRHFRPVVKSTVSQLRAAFSNTEFRPGGGRDCVANYWQSNPEDTDGPSIKFW